MPKKIIIIGGVAGGATTAARLRRLDETSTIILFEKGEHISFANCGLPYYIGNAIKERQKLLVQTVKSMSQRFNLDIRNLSEVIKINRDQKTVTVQNLKTQEVYEESYDHLVLSPGARPIVPPIKGLNEANHLFTLRTIPDADAIKHYIKDHQPKQAVIVGGGFIGLEMAENLVGTGIKVTLIEMANQVMAPLDFEMASIVHNHLNDKGITLILEDGVHSFEDEGNTIVLASGRRLPSDLTILSIGVRPENKLAKEAGLTIGERGGIQVNACLQTNDPTIYAIGDAIEVFEFVNGTKAMIPLAGIANRQGRLAADHIYDQKTPYKGALGTAIAKVFDLAVGTTGSNEKLLKRLGVDYKAIHIHPTSHAGYYPGANPISLKLLFDPTSGAILGAQAIGKDGVDKRIDVLATAIKGKLTVFDLTELELSYAPPFSSAKDPINMAGYVATNLFEEAIETVQWHQIDAIVQNGGFLIDVREPKERENGFIKGSVNIPLSELRDHLEQLPKNKPIYLNCQVGLRGYLATRILKGHGFQAINLDGGWKTYAAIKAHTKGALSVN